ncbi:MAG TPA: APC family permease [Candidatus Micrarchaeaceae archaeon]|jgi:amino acid transporter|nr:APC family permease [Candidatus Micrarchaeaceae archaeon]
MAETTSGSDFASGMGAPKGVFTRASSGLVRQVGSGDVLFYGWGQITLGFIIFTIAAWQFYPGASMELAVVLALVGGLAMGVVYAFLTTIYPRSGGEYVFLSRAIHPLVGFVASLSFAFWEIFYSGIVAAFLSIFGLSPLFGTLGLQLHNSGLSSVGTWFGQAQGIFISGAVVIVVISLLIHRGLGRYFRIQRWGMWVVAGSLVLTVVVLALSASGVFSFKHNFDALAGAGAYAKVVADGIKAGAVYHSGFNLTSTIEFMIWPAFSIWFAVASVSFSGEVKNVQRGQLLGISGAMITMGIASILLMFFSRAAFGNQFLIGAPAVPAAHFPVPLPPYINSFAGIAGGNPILTVLMSLWVIGTMVFDIGATLIYGNRAILAWSLDGLVPERFGRVSERFHSPTWAIGAAAVVALVWLGLYAFTSLLAILSGFMGLALTFMLVCVGGILFPYLKRRVFDASPIAFKLGRLPLVTVLGVVGLIFTGYVFYRLFLDSAFGSNKPFPIWMAFGVVVLAAIWLYGARAYRKSRGVDIDSRFKEIPIE